MVLRKHVWEFVLRTIIQPFLLCFVFLYVFPKIGQGIGGGHGTAAQSAFATILVPGVVGISVMFQGVQSIALAMAQEFGFTREIEDRVQAPCPIWLVAVAKVLSGAAQGVISAIIVLPIASVVHAPGVQAHLTLHWWIIVTFVPLACVAMAGLGLVLGTSFEPRNIGLMFGFIILPITFLGGTYYSWTKLAPVTVGGWHWLQTLVLINPLIYVNEGMRAALPTPRACPCTSSTRSWPDSARCSWPSACATSAAASCPNARAPRPAPPYASAGLASLARTSSMSSSPALVISCSSAASGRAPGWAYSTMLSLMIIRVGMDAMLKVAASSGCASVSTLPNTASGCRSDTFSKTGPNIRHGPHHSAQKSTSTRAPSVTVSLKFSAVSSTVAISASSRLIPVGVLTTATRQKFQKKTFNAERVHCVWYLNPEPIAARIIPPDVQRPHGEERMLPKGKNTRRRPWAAEPAGPP